MRRLVAMTLVVLMPTLGSGCFGSFSLTRQLYQFNKDVSPEKWARWFIFLLLAILPYGVAMLIDAVLGNSVEFWGGDNPFAVGDPRTRVAIGPSGEVIRLARDAEGRIDVEYTDRAGDVHRARFVREGDLIVALSPEGMRLASVRP